MTTFTVDVFADEEDGDTSAGHLSLREAIGLANANSNPDTIDTIKFSLAGQTIVLTLGELALTEDVTIDGDVDGDHKADITISGNDASRIFNISGGNTDVTLQSLTLTDGHAVAGLGLTDGQGGAVLAYDSGLLTIIDTTIKDSNADSHGGGLSVEFGDRQHRQFHYPPQHVGRRGRRSLYHKQHRCDGQHHGLFQRRG